MKRGRPGATAAFLPTREQELLLQACLFEGEDGLAAWRSWQASVDFDRLDPASVRLLPLLAERLAKCGVEDVRLGAYRGVQRRTWARNVMLFRGAAGVIRRLRAANVTCMALKGLVLARSCYDAASLRPMGDFDLLIRMEDAEAAFDALEAAAWRPQAPSQRPRNAADFAARASCVYEDPENPDVSVDLHWRLFWARCSAEADEDLWARAAPFSVEAEGCLAPSWADMLLHVCAHGARWNGLPPQRWVADSVTLLNTKAVEWDHLCQQARRWGLGPPLADALGYLRAAMRAEAPAAVLERLTRMKTSPIDRLVYASELRPPQRRGLLAATRLHRHIAHEHLGGRGYWSYLQAVRAGRSLRAMAGWAADRLRASLL